MPPLRRPAAAFRAVALVALLPALALLRPVGAQGGPTIPPPTGLVSDFAGVIPAPQAARITRILEDVRAKSGGEIAVVTLPDLGGRDVGDVALRIGREWGVGAKAAVGDRTRNAGVVVLLVPKETSGDGRGHLSIQTGQGAEGFITDAMAGELRRDATEFFKARDYGGGLLLVVDGLADRYAGEFGFTRDSLARGAEAPRRARSGGRGGVPVMLFFVAVFLMIVIGGRRRPRSGLGDVALLIASEALRSRHRGGWGGGGFSGGDGGGFGGFGGGGGFSGGGSSGSW